MNREQALATLRAHAAELKAAGVVSLSLFGSTARKEAARDDSDIDIAIKVGTSFSSGGLDFLKRLDDMQERLSVLLACPVDLIAEPVRKPRLQKQIDRDRAVAF
jgi:predicted nucleotidyltransferase